MLKVLHVNITDNAGKLGGMARLLHEQLPDHGIESRLFVYQQSDFIANIYSLREEENAWSDKLLEKGKELQSPEVYAPHLMSLIKHQEFAEADVIHLHGTGEYFSYLLLPFLTAKPLVWTLYDCKPYTGGCIHSAHCQQWQQGECATCPIDQRQNNDAIRSKLYNLKRDIYLTMDVNVISVNQWQNQQIKTGILQDKPLYNIPLAVDTRIFHPGDKAWFRRELDLPQDAFILIYHCVMGLEEAGAKYLRQALQEVANQHHKLLLVCIGLQDETYFAGVNVQVKSVKWTNDSSILADYCRAGDVLVHPYVLDQTFLSVCKAAACGMPAVVFNIGAASEIVEHQQTGYVAESMNSHSFANGLLWLMQDAREQAGKRAAEHAWRENNLSHVREEYIKLYRSIVPSALTSAIPTDSIQVRKKAIDVAHRAWQSSKQLDKVLLKLDEALKQFDDNKKSRGMFVDAFFTQCLAYVDIKKNKEEIWGLTNLWLQKRAPELRCGNLPDDENYLHVEFCKKLRSLLVQYFVNMPLHEYQALKTNSHEVIFRLWRYIFLNVQSAINLDMAAETVDIALLNTEQGQTGYPKLLLQSMFIPYPEEDSKIVMARLMQSKMPLGMKMIVMLWLTNCPVYSGTDKNRDIVVKSIQEFCEYAVSNLASNAQDGFIQICLENFVASLWRVSYIGGNNIAALSAFGDFVRAMTLKKYAAYEIKDKQKQKKRKKAKLRIGYVSMNFRMQAVSFYMANRILLHDPEKFEIYTFVLKRNDDDMTEKIRQASDKVFEYTDLKNLEPIIKEIVNSELDILIYADIGMDPFTYQLGSLRLVPVQAVLVGHGVTTGLEKIDYYISGDFEPENAQSHYREKLITLPKLGAAQIPPLVNRRDLTRKTIGVPEDAVLLMSFANGIKFHVDRDILFVEILKQAPQAWIVLKPFQSPNTIDSNLSERIMKLARQHGVADRLIILPPLANPADLWGLLTLADIQLDTYPYGGWTTNMEALYAGLPIVTQEGDMARSRWGAGMLRALDVKEGIAYTEKEYVEWAVRLVNDKELLVQVKEKIKGKVEDILFNGVRAQGTYEDMLIKVLQKKVK